MTAKTLATNTVKWAEAKDLYVRLLHSFYERNEIAKSKSLALSLLRIIDALDRSAKTLPGLEYRALIAEIDNDIDGAIRYRETFVNKIDEFVRLRPLQDLVLEPIEYADHLDLLALLYCQGGLLDKAEETIHKSAKYCEENRIPFDGRDVQKQIEKARKSTKYVSQSKLTSNKRKVIRKPITNDQ